MSGPSSKELGNNFKGHALGFWDLEIDEHPRDDTNHCIDGEYTCQPNGSEHDRQCVGDDDVTYPED